MKWRNDMPEDSEPKFLRLAGGRMVVGMRSVSPNMWNVKGDYFTNKEVMWLDESEPLPTVQGEKEDKSPLQEAKSPIGKVIDFMSENWSMKEILDDSWLKGIWDALCYNLPADQQRTQRIKKLEDWKESAMKHTPDLQAIAKLIGVKLGDSIHDKIIPYIKTLQSQQPSPNPTVLIEALNKMHKSIKYYKLEEQFGLDENDFIAEALQSSPSSTTESQDELWNEIYLLIDQWGSKDGGTLKHKLQSKYIIHKR